MVRLFASAAALLALVGCVPLAAPPAEGQVGVGARTNRSRGDVPLQVRASVRPLELAPSLFYRRADFGVGYLLDKGSRSTLQGGYLEVATIPYVGRPVLDPQEEATRRSRHLLPEGDTVRRFMMRGQGRLVYDDGMHELGGGFALQVTYEWAAFAVSPGGFTANKSGIGSVAAYGEAGIGFFAEGAFMHFPTSDTWTASAGVVVKLPALIGIFCCVIPR